MSSRPQPTLLLASASPRRREILARAGYRFRLVAAPEVEERSHGRPEVLAPHNARLKARAAWAATPPGEGEVVLGADTVVVLGPEVLGKPRSRAEAARMLRALSGRWHRVMTALCLRDAAGREVQVRESTRVRFAELAPRDIRVYLATGEADDKAGAYGIQGRMAPFVPRVSGCYFNVVGLSPAALRRGLRRLTGQAEGFLCGPEEY